MAVRNACVARGVLAAGTLSTVYTVPASSVLLLKSFLVQNNGPNAGNLYASIHAVGGTVNVDFDDVATTSGQIIAWSGWIALNAGDYIQILHTGSQAQYWLSGAVLPYATP